MSAEMIVVAPAAEAERSEKSYPGEIRGFAAEMRSLAMKLHARDQAQAGEKDIQLQLVANWEPTIGGYLMFLVDSKFVYDTLAGIVSKAHFPEYVEFRNTGLERSENLEKDLEWFKKQGHVIPEPSKPGISYALFLEELSEKDLHAFICHIYTIYFGHTAGGQIIGKRVAEKIFDGKELEFYKWNGDVSPLLLGIREKLNRVAESWTQEEKNRCLEEIEKSFKLSTDMQHLILS